MKQHYQKPIVFLIATVISLVAYSQNPDIETTAEIKHLILYNSSAELQYQKE